MKIAGYVLTVSALGLLLLAGANTSPALHFPLHHFSIDPLETPTAGTNSVLLIMNLTPSDGFAPNVNVMTQNYPGTLDDYIALSKQQTATADWNWLKGDKIDDTTAIIEYTGKKAALSLHFYAKVSRKGQEFILTTATATEKQWATSSPQLRACVESFHRDADQ